MKASKSVDGDAFEKGYSKGAYFALTMRLLALGLILLSLMLSTEGLFVVILLFIIVVPFEKLFPGLGQKVRRPKLGTDMVMPLHHQFRDTDSNCWCFHCGD